MHVLNVCARWRFEVRAYLPALHILLLFDRACKDDVKRAMDSFCDGARSLWLWWRGKDKNHTWIHRARQDEWADVANRAFVGTSCFFVTRQGLEQWMCLSVVRRFDRQCNLLILLWSSCVIGLAIGVGKIIGLRGRWQDDRSHGTHYFASLTSSSNLRKHVWVQWNRKLEISIAFFEATYSWSVRRSDLLSFVLPFRLSLTRVLQNI